jgi:hypothetical protein
LITSVNITHQAPNIVLIFNEAKTHIDVSIVHITEANNIVLFCLPSKMTHHSKPFDQGINVPFEEFWDQQVINYWKTHPQMQITHGTLGYLLKKVWNRAMTPVNVRNRNLSF